MRARKAKGGPGTTYYQNTLDGRAQTKVYLTLQKDYREGAKGKYDKTITVQKCGGEPYELALRFANCCLRCGACFASGYSWASRFRSNPRVVSNRTVDDVVREYEKIEYPSGYSNYNWLRVLGGEPLLNDEYINFLFNVLIRISEIDSNKFRNGIIIQTNGIYIGKGNTDLLSKKLQELYDVNPIVKVVIEVSIKGTNVEEFKLVTRTYEDDLFRFNLESYFNLRKISSHLPNLRPMVIAGYGVNESYLLSEGKSSDRITIIFKDNKPIYHPDFWSEDFERLYGDFTSTYNALDSMFSKMPMYGIKDQFNYGWVKRAIRQGERVYGNRWYDKRFADERDGRNLELEDSFPDILEKFFLVNNQKYYSTMIK